MGMNTVGQTCPYSVPTHDLLDAPLGETATIPIKQERLGSWRGDQMWAASLQVSLNGLQPGAGHGNNALFVALSDYANRALGWRYIAKVQSSELRQTQAGAIQELQDGAIPEKQWLWSAFRR